MPLHTEQNPTVVAERCDGCQKIYAPREDPDDMENYCAQCAAELRKHEWPSDRNPDGCHACGVTSPVLVPLPRGDKVRQVCLLCYDRAWR